MLCCSQKKFNCEKRYKTFGEIWITALKNFNMLSSGSTFSSLHIRRSAGNNKHFLSILMQYDCGVAQEENPFSIILSISFSAFFYSLDVFSLFHRLFKQYRIKNIWLPLGIEPRTGCIVQKQSWV